LLTKWALVAIRAREDEKFCKLLAMNAHDIQAASALLKSLEEGNVENVGALHDLNKSLFYSRDLPSHSKWDHPFECFLAIYALRTGGVFMPVRDVTQIFAQLKYHIRGMVLYEAHLTATRIGGSLYE
jgi:hypothetical protein